MTRRKEQNHANTPLDRREFIAVAAAAGAVLAMAGCAQMPIANPDSRRERSDAQRIGPSPEAYKKAWNRAAALADQMTLAEKIAQTGISAPAIKRLGLPAYSYYSGEALHGLVRAAPVTSFPLPLAMACSWNPALARKVYTAVSDEARAYHKKENIGLSYYSPQTLNLHRDPRWGRCEEAPGEDPCLAGTWAVQVVLGMQGNDPNYLKTTACAKHFICNNTDDDRMEVSASVDARSFWEYYTRAYRACVTDAGVFTVMSAYNAVNGVPCSADRFLLTSLLRDRWGFRGYVTSDCDAVYNIYNPHHYVPTLHQAAALAMQAGCDLNCGDTYQKHLAKAVDLELLSEADISRAVTRLLTARCLLGLFDPPERVAYNRITFDVVDSPAHRALAVEAARQSLVLLKNDNNFLPLDKSALKKVAVIGPLAGFHLGGYSGQPTVQISPLEGIAAALGAEIYYPEILAGSFIRSGGGKRAIQTAPSDERSVYVGFITNGSWLEFKPQDFTGKKEIVIRVASQTRGGSIEVRLESLHGPLAATLKVPPTGGWQNWTNVSAPLHGVTGEHKVFFKFSGNGLYLFNVEQFQLTPPPPPPSPQPGKPQLVYHPGCGIIEPKKEELFRKAVDAARDADMVIMVCGVNQSVDQEGQDRKTTGLTGAHHELIQACYAANPKTVLVLSSNNTVAVNWEQAHLPAIVAAIFAGQAQGTAIADVLFGDYNPGGKTCCTWYQSVEQLPPFHNYDIRKGRTYMYFEGKPLYPFGFGLSYTRFQMSDLKVSSDTLGPGGSITLTALIQNIGQRRGAEVVQFYITAPKSPVQRPIKQLVGFQRVELAPGESKSVSFHLSFLEQALWYWHEAQRKFVLAPGELHLLIGSSSADIHLRATVQLQPAVGDPGGPETLCTVAAPARVR